MSILADAFTFLVAVGGSFVIQVGADLPLADVLLIPALPALVALRRERLRRSRFKTMFILLAIGLVGEIIADVFHSSAAADWLRVDARYCFIAIGLLAMAVLVGKSIRRQVIFFLGYALGLLLQVKLQPGVYTDFWKFGYGPGSTIAVVLFSCIFFRKRMYTAAILTISLIAAINAAFNFRSPILMLFVTVVLVTPVVPERIGHLTILPRGNSTLRIATLMLLAMLGAKGAGTLVLYLGRAGFLGEDARLKNELQANSKGGLLIGGRPEILVSSRAVFDSPVLGHGAWAKDMRYVEMYTDMMIEYGEWDEDTSRQREEDREVIPTHSHIMDAWVDAGILGALFWFYVLYLIGKGILTVAITRPPLAPIYAFSLVSFFWNVLFSPAGGITILPEAFLLVVLCDLLEKPAKAPISSLPVYRVKRHAFRVPQRRPSDIRPSH